MISWFDRHLKTINWVLLVLIILVNGYVILAPLVPEVQYQVTKRTTKELNVNNPDELAGIDRNSDHLIIPRLRLDKPIFDGTNPNLVHKGIWRRPNTSSPDKGGNTVMVGHRFSYKDPAILYSLDKVQLKDPLIVAWRGKLYLYRVSDIKVVPANAIEVENPTSDSRLTIYTCTPLWSTRNRLVVTGSLERIA
jgi:sortase A